MKQKKSTEDYLKTIYGLNYQEGVHGADIAKQLNVSRPTVSVALKALAQEGYVWTDKSRRVRLTDRGLLIAKGTYERHHIFQELLISLCISPEIAAQDVCEMEHSVSPESFLVIKLSSERLKSKA